MANLQAVWANRLASVKSSPFFERAEIISKPLSHSVDNLDKHGTKLASMGLRKQD
jgi:hypothetical protein